MDSNDLEKERGITILSKVTSVGFEGKVCLWRGTRRASMCNVHGADAAFERPFFTPTLASLSRAQRINIVDTPGHADFGGEVERVLSMVQGVVLLVDATEGPMPQTKFVLQKALKQAIMPVVVINKCDRPSSRVDEVKDEVLDLFFQLEANDAQLEFPTLLASAKDGWTVDDLEKDERKDMAPLFRAIVKHIPPPQAPTFETLNDKFRFLVTLLDKDQYLGKLVTGRVLSGSVEEKQSVGVLNANDASVSAKGRITKILYHEGKTRTELTKATAGDIITLAGVESASVGDTIVDPEITEAVPTIAIDKPTISMTFYPNTSPLCGTEGDLVTTRQIEDRLRRECEVNVGIQFEVAADGESYEVKGRGELQLGILLENMRREGFEVAVSKPRVLFTMEDGVRMEPIEEVMVDVDEAYMGSVVDKLSRRKGEMVDMKTFSDGRVRLMFKAPSRGLIGYTSEFQTDTRGTGLMNHRFSHYEAHKGKMDYSRKGVLVSMSAGQATGHALANLEARGIMFVEPQAKIYEGMIVGEHTRDVDLDVNPVKGKALSNMRSSGKDEAVRLSPARTMSLEEALTYVATDELVEVTPNSIRLRKKILNKGKRDSARKSNKNMEV